MIGMDYYWFTVLHILISSLLTFHILLIKSNVRSAIGWMGIVWFSPYLGSLIYYFFGINRIARRAKNIGYARKHVASLSTKAKYKLVDLPGYLEPIAQITTSEITFGNTLEVLRSGDKAYPEMLSAISAATSEIVLQMYIFRNDRIGVMFRDALIAAHSRGVEVRILVDGIGSGYFFSSIVFELQKAGIPAYRFIHFWAPWRMTYLNLRNHKKLLIIDNKIGYVGGMNLGGENVLTKYRDRMVNDTHFKIKGPIVQYLTSIFDQDWQFTTGKLSTDKEGKPEARGSGKAIARCIASGPDEDGEIIETIFSMAILSAREKIRIVTPYFLPDTRLVAFLQMAMLRGVEIELIIPQKTDLFFMDWAMNGHLPFLKNKNLKCYRSPPPFDHSKLLTIDGNWCAFGSPNWDARSMRLNFEILIECYDVGSVKILDALIDEKRDQAQLFKIETLSKRNLAIRLRDAFARLFLPYV